MFPITVFSAGIIIIQRNILCLKTQVSLPHIEAGTLCLLRLTCVPFHDLLFKNRFSSFTYGL